MNIFGRIKRRLNFYRDLPRLVYDAKAHSETVEARLKEHQKESKNQNEEIEKSLNTIDERLAEYNAALQRASQSPAKASKTV